MSKRSWCEWCEWCDAPVEDEEDTVEVYACGSEAGDSEAEGIYLYHALCHDLSGEGGESA